MHVGSLMDEQILLLVIAFKRMFWTQAEPCSNNNASQMLRLHKVDPTPNIYVAFHNIDVAMQIIVCYLPCCCFVHLTLAGCLITI